MFDQKFDRKHIKYAWNCCTSEKLFQHLAEFVGNLGQRVDRIENLDLDKYADTIKEIQSDISSLTSSIEKVQTTATGNTEMIVNLLTDLETLTNQVDELAEGTTVEIYDLEQQINDTAGTISDIQILISNIQTKLNTVEDSVDTLDANTQASLDSINERIDSLVTSEEEWHNNIVEQMDDLTDHFGDIEDLVYGFNSDITSMKSDISSLESEISTVTNKCDTLEDEVTDLDERVTVLENEESGGGGGSNIQIQCGSEHAPVSAYTTGKYEVVFDTPFTSTPIVVVTPASDIYSTQGFGNTMFGAVDTTTEGFSIQYANAVATSSFNIYVNWIAVSVQ